MIVRVDGQPVVASGDLPARIGMAKPGDSVKLQVWRQGKSEQLTAQLGGAEGKELIVALKGTGVAELAASLGMCAGAVIG